MLISLPKEFTLRCSIRAINEKYVTLRYQINLNKYLKNSYNLLTFQCF